MLSWAPSDDEIEEDMGVPTFSASPAHAHAHAQAEGEKGEEALRRLHHDIDCVLEQGRRLLVAPLEHDSRHLAGWAASAETRLAELYSLCAGTMKEAKAELQAAEARCAQLAADWQEEHAELVRRAEQMSRRHAEEWQHFSSTSASMLAAAGA